MKSILLGIISAILFASFPAFATITGKELLNNCMGKSNNLEESKNRGNNRDFCIGYVAGFLDTYVLTSALHRVHPDDRYFCLGNKGISYSRAMQITVGYLQDHPKELNDTARNLLVKAFAEKYPCQKRDYDSQHRNQNYQNKDDRYQDI